jgi:hypothetical protein
MPRGPKGEKRPANTYAAAVMVARIATGEIRDKVTNDGKNAAAIALGLTDEALNTADIVTLIDKRDEERFGEKRAVTLDSRPKLA